MGLPNNREATITTASTLPPNLLNIIQDCIIGAKRPSFWRPSIPVLGTPGSWSYQPGVTWLQSSGTALGGILQIDADEGDRITNYQIAAWGTGASNLSVSVSVIKLSTMALVQTLCSGNDVNRAAAWGAIDAASLVGGFAPRVIGADEAVFAVLVPSVANMRIGVQRAQFDRL